jgi:outer membrane protein OmpA-like peptidoglycan-associated protein
VGVPFADGAAEARVELFGATGLSDFGAREGSPLEVLGGVAARPHASSGFVGGIALGTGLTRGYGAPDARVVLTAGYVEPAPQPAIEEPPAPPPRDSDGDGLVDDVDACPTDPEDPDGFEDEDGCPDADNDGDGLLDADDQCPMDAEDADGFEDENGCPDPDNDGDGVLDVDDRCPAEPEDLDNVADQDGCPEEDADEDTVLDPDDRCPTTAGAPNRRNADCNGCPERACITATGMIQILERVEFETNSAEIRSQSEAVLRDVLSILETSPQIVRVRIEGHTDDRGDDAYNLELSQRRGESVMRWLVEHGLSAGRLEAQGFGETRPLRPGRSTRARQANRRVEFHIVPQESAPQK